jgi:hypothetical protein
MAKNASQWRIRDTDLGGVASRKRFILKEFSYVSSAVFVRPRHNTLRSFTIIISYARANPNKVRDIVANLHMMQPVNHEK